MRTLHSLLHQTSNCFVSSSCTISSHRLPQPIIFPCKECEMGGELCHLQSIKTSFLMPSFLLVFWYILQMVVPSTPSPSQESIQHITGTHSFASLTNSLLNNPLITPHRWPPQCPHLHPQHHKSLHICCILEPFLPSVAPPMPSSCRPMPGAYEGGEKKMLQWGYPQHILHMWRGGMGCAWSPGQGHQLYIQPQGNTDKIW